MKMDPSIAGRRLGGIVREVTWRDTTGFAASVGDANPRYLDDSIEGGLVAPPLFAVALTWPLVSRIPERLEGGLPAELVPTIVHAGEHLRFHRMLRPGDRIGMEARVVSLRPGRAGTRMTVRIDGVAGGEPVFTEHSTALFRGVDCPEVVVAEDEPVRTSRLDDGGTPLWEATIPVAREAPFIYDGCTGITFAIHTSVTFARAVGLPDLLLQGTYALALAAREIVDREVGGDPARLKEIACRFTGMIVPGAPVRVQFMNREVAAASASGSFRVLDSRGSPALDAGWARMQAV